MSLDKKIQDTFNPPPSLDGEDWLMPSDDVFDAIEGAVYPDDSSKKRRLPFWLWLIPLLLISILGITFFDHSEEKELLSNNPEIHNVPEANESIEYSKMDSKDDNLNSNNKNTKTKSGLLVSELVRVKSNQSIEIKNIKTLPRNIDSNAGSETLSSNVSKEFNFDVLKEKFEISKAPKEILLGTGDLSVQGQFPQMDLLDYRLLLLSSERNVISAPTSIQPIDTQSSNPQNWFVKFTTGASLWDFNLSNNYLVALQPADFTHSDGDGYFLELGLEKTISNRIKLGLLTSYDRNQFDSGHNSIINYDLSNENDDRTKGFDLTMASPLGFLESNIIVARSIDAPNNTNLTIDLDNRHTVINIDLGLYADVSLVEYGRLGLSSQLGGGLSYLSQVSNSLDKFSTSESGFDSHSSSITANQADLKRLRSYFNVGLSLGYNWSSSTVVGVSYQYRRDINSVYQSGDFSTLVQRQLSGIYLKKRI